MRCILYTFTLLTFILGCKKDSTNGQCQGTIMYSDSFAVREIVGDTSFVADTIFRDNYAQFETLLTYDSVQWKIGKDPRTFTTASFPLSFHTVLESMTIKFTGFKGPNTVCFPTDNGVYSGEKQLTVVEQFDKNTLTISPLAGKYHGHFTDAPADTFTVRIDYFDSAKYNTAYTGSKNFYWISNIPKGFQGTTWANETYPELKNGQEVDMGYKSLVFGSSCGQGRGWLSKDSLFISYGNAVCGRKKFIAKKIP